MRTWLCGLLLCAGVALADTGADPLLAQLDTFEAQHDRFPRRPESAAEAFRPLAEHAAAPDLLNDAALRRLFEAAYVTVFYTHDAAVADTAHKLLHVLEGRGAATDAQRTDLHKLWVLTRRFERANALAEAFPQLSRRWIPVVDDQTVDGAGSPTALFVTPDAGLVRREVRLDAAAEVLVVASSSCGFSLRAVQAIEADPLLRAVFERHARWVQGPTGYLDVPAMQEWNRSHPLAPLMHAWSTAEWAPLDLHRMPVFHFLRDGEIVHSVIGWRGAESQAEVADGLRRVGLID
jgi:hypothetical protein